jgi:hypothetical protein
MKKTFLLFIIGIIFGLISCATKLPAFDPLLPNSETAVIVIPKDCWIREFNGEKVNWTTGRIRIPAGSHTFLLDAVSKVQVPASAEQLYFLGIRTVSRNIQHSQTKKLNIEAGQTYVFKVYSTEHAETRIQDIVFDIRLDKK